MPSLLPPTVRTARGARLATQRLLSARSRAERVVRADACRQLIVSESHQIALLSPPSPAPRAKWTRQELTRGGSAAGEVYYPHGLRCSPCGRYLYVADRSNQRVQCLDLLDPEARPITSQTCWKEAVGSASAVLPAA